MAVVRFIILAFASFPALMYLLFVFYSPPLIAWMEGFADSPKGALAGSALGYYGLLFSLFAALEVRNLSDRYRFRLRSPEIRKKLASISRQVQSFGTEPSQEILSQKFIHETVVALRAAKRINNKEAKRIAGEANTALRTLLRQVGIDSNIGMTAGEVPGYWDYFQKISELTEELKTQLDDVRSVQ